MSNIKKLPRKLDHIRTKSQLADYLRTIADYIEGDMLDVAPEAIMMVLTGDRYHEVLVTEGYSDYQGLLREACFAARIAVEQGNNHTERKRFKKKLFDGDMPSINKKVKI